MAKRKRYLGLSVFLGLYGTHPNAWRRPGVKAGGNPSFQQWAELVQLLERAKFDFAFFADFVGSSGDAAGNGKHPRGSSFEPTTLVAALSQVTSKIGLVATVNTNFNEPYNLARRFASLDHLSGGRVGWNVVSSHQAGATKSFGVENPLEHDLRYERAGEFIDISKKLWDSWEDGAFDHPDPVSGQYYDPKNGHPVHYRGKHFSLDAIADIPRPIQGYPVLFQAGNSDVGREFAAEHAEVIYAAAQTIEEAQAFYSDVKGRMAKYGRDPDDLKITPGLSFYIGETRQEAQEKYESFLSAVDVSGYKELFGVDISQYPLDGPLPDLPPSDHGRGRWKQMTALARRENLSIRDLILRFEVVKGHRVIVGTALDVADQLEDWFQNGAADGFNFKAALVPDSIEDFVNGVVPELQRRGIFRTEYEGSTLREHLGLPRPPNQNSQVHEADAVAAE